MTLRPWWDRRLIPWLVLIAVAIPLAWPTIPPLLDLPGHMASYHVALDVADTPLLHRYFSFAWHVIGNLGVDILIIPVGRVLGVELGTKVVAILIPVLTAFGFLSIAREVHGRIPPTAFAAVPLAYNYPLMFGFVNYSLSVAIALLTFSLWLSWPSCRNTFRRAFVFGILAVAVWLSHAIGWVMLCALAGAAETHGRLASGQRVDRVLIGTMIACFPLLTPIPLNILSPHTGGMTAYGFFQPLDIAKWTITLLRDRWMWWDLASAALLFMLIGFALLRCFGLSIAPRLGWPALALLILYTIAPQSINDSAFVAARIVPYVAALAILAINVSDASRMRQAAWAAMCICFMILRLGGNTTSFFLYDRDYSYQLDALRYIPHGSSVVTFGPVPCKSTFSNWFNPRTYHLPGLALTRNDAFINATWSISGLQLLQVHYPQAGTFQSDPSDMVYLDPCKHGGQLTLEQAIRTFPRSAFNRLWLVHVPRDHWPSDPQLTPIWWHEDSVLYAIQGSPLAQR